MRIKIVVLVGAISLAGIMSLGLAFSTHSASQHRSSAADLILPPYDEEQKVVYHITEGDTWYRSHTTQLLGSIRNHVNAVPKGKLEIRVVLQGDGLDVLRSARTDQTIATAVDRLKADGVRFYVCRNTLVSRHMEPSELYDLKAEDIVGAGVAEASRLQKLGFVYLKL